jgi:hypothetical protein
LEIVVVLAMCHLPQVVAVELVELAAPLTAPSAEPVVTGTYPVSTELQRIMVVVAVVAEQVLQENTV